MKQKRKPGRIEIGAEVDFKRGSKFSRAMRTGRRSANIQDQRPETTGIAPLSSAGYSHETDRTFLGGAVPPNLNKPVPREGMSAWNKQREDEDEVSSYAAQTGTDKKSAEDWQPMRNAMRDMVKSAQGRVRDRLASEKAREDYERKVGKAPEGSAGYGYQSSTYDSPAPNIEKKVPIMPYDDPTRVQSPMKVRYDHERRKRPVRYREPR